MWYAGCEKVFFFEVCITEAQSFRDFPARFASDVPLNGTDPEAGTVWVPGNLPLSLAVTPRKSTLL